MIATRLATRLDRVRERLIELEADALVIPPSADFRWLTGASARSSERLLVLVVPRATDPYAIVPRLEADALAAHVPWLELVVWEESEDPLALLSRRLDLDRSPALLVGEGWRVGALLGLARAARCRPAGALLEPLRVTKDAEELEAIVEAGRHADRVAEAIADAARAGMTERELARRALTMFEDLGDTEPWAIVAFAENSALPHHTSTDRRLADGEVLLIDVGAYTRGYGSDITRTYVLGSVPDGVRRVYDIVNRARAAGIAAVREGVTPESVDRAARTVITDAGFGPQFVHRTGHGVGLEVHEPPYIVAGNKAPLAAGMVHSVEPGIYLSGKFGIRIEDLVAVEKDGARRLNQAPTDPRPPRMRG